MTVSQLTHWKKSRCLLSGLDRVPSIVSPHNGQRFDSWGESLLDRIVSIAV